MLIKLIAFLIIFTIIVLAHEIGHFVFSRLAGIRVLELGMGLGPRLIGVIKNRTKYTLNLLPIGGFVRIAGLDEDIVDKSEQFTASESYLNKSPGQKFLSIFGGPFFNMLLALLIFYVMFVFVGVPKDISNEISTISPNSEASRVGFRPGDRIIGIDGKNTVKMSDAIIFIHNNPGRKIAFKIERYGKTFTVVAVPKLNAKMKMGLIGFSFKPVYVRTNPISALFESLYQVIGTSIVVLYTLGLLIVGRISLFDLAGPVGIAQYTGQIAGEGLIPLASFTAFLSINLGLLNLLPIPALDGGRLVFIIIEWVRKKAVNAELENRIHEIGFILLLSIMALVTISDIFKIFVK